MNERKQDQAVLRVAVPLVLLTCTAFAMWPLEVSHVSARLVKQPTTAQTPVAPLDLAAFRVPLWVADPAPPRPPPPARPTPPTPPLKLQLIAIIHEGDVYKAAVYDPDSDRLLVVVSGERIGARSVERVDKASLTLRDDAGKRTIALKEGS